MVNYLQATGRSAAAHITLRIAFEDCLAWYRHFTMVVTQRKHSFGSGWRKWSDRQWVQHQKKSTVIEKIITYFTFFNQIINIFSSNLLFLNLNSISASLSSKFSASSFYNLFCVSWYFRYKTPPRPILRHIILSDFKEKVPLAPFINQETEPIVMYDPLPPLDSINIYAKPTLTPQSRLLPDASPLSMFFQSLLPNFNVQGGRFVAPEAIPGGDAARNAEQNHRDPAVAWDENIAHDQQLMDELRLIDEIDNGMLNIVLKILGNEMNLQFILYSQLLQQTTNWISHLLSFGIHWRRLWTRCAISYRIFVFLRCQTMPIWTKMRAPMMAPTITTWHNFPWTKRKRAIRLKKRELFYQISIDLCAAAHEHSNFKKKLFLFSPRF